MKQVLPLGALVGKMVMISLKFKFKFVTLIFVFFISSIQFAYSAGVGLNATRLIYNEGEKSISITVNNNDANVNYLTRAYITVEDNSTIPFTITPPLFKVEGNSKNIVKIFTKQHKLPKDRESVFYFHAMMIPGGKTPDEGAGLSVGFDNVIKLFYRPKNLSLSSNEAQKELKFNSTYDGISVINESPYYISFSNITVNGEKVNISMENKNTMVSPFSTINYKISQHMRKGTVRWVTINDLGGMNAHTGTIK